MSLFSTSLLEERVGAISMKIDSRRSSIDNFLALLKKSNPKLSITSSQVRVGIPKPSTVKPGANTTVTLSAVKNAGWAGSYDLHYRRLALSEVALGPYLPIRAVLGESVETTIARACSVMGILATDVKQSNVETYVAPTERSPLQTLQLVPRTISMLYMGPTTLDVLVMLPEVKLTNLPEFMLAPDGWINSEVMGWRNDGPFTNPDSHVSVFTAQHLQYLKSISGVFTCYYNEPKNASGIIEAVLHDAEGVSTGIGLRDMWVSSTKGLQIVRSGELEEIHANVVDLDITHLVKEGEVPTRLTMSSGAVIGPALPNSNPNSMASKFSYRGVKDLTLTFNTVG